MATAEFTSLVDEYYAKLYRFAIGLSRSEDDAADLTQQTFLIWATKGYQLRDKSKVKSWLFTTLYREFLKEARRSNRMKPLELEDFRGETPAVEHGGESHVDHREVLKVIQNLNESYRMPLMLFYTEELSYKEIAKALDIPIGTVMTRLSRGRDQIRRQLEKHSAPVKGTNVVPFNLEQRKSAGNE